MDKSPKDREEHIAWALVGLENFTKAMKLHNKTGNPGALVLAYKHAYGTEINLLDAGHKELAELWKQARIHIGKDIRNRMMGRTAKKSPPKDPNGHKWKGPLPKGWTDESRKKFWDSLTARAPKHKVTLCIKRMEGKVGNPGAFCASLADRVIPGWRQEAAKERRKKKKAHVAKVLTELEKEYDYEPGQDGRGLLQFRYDYNQIPQKPTKKRPRSMIPGKDQLGLDPDDPLYRKRLAKPRDPLEPTTEDKERKGLYDEDENEEKPHSQMPGADDSLTMEMDHRVGSQNDEEGGGRARPSPKWFEFLEQVYEGGRRMVDNPDPDHRERTPKIQMQTRMKKDPSFARQIHSEFQNWIAQQQQGQQRPQQQRRRRRPEPSRVRDEDLSPDMGKLNADMMHGWSDDHKEAAKPVYSQALREIATGERKMDAEFAQELVGRLGDAGVPVEGMSEGKFNEASRGELALRLFADVAHQTTRRMKDKWMPEGEKYGPPDLMPKKTRKQWDRLKRLTHGPRGTAGLVSREANRMMRNRQSKQASQWITRTEMETLCPSCAVRMKKAGFTKVHVSVMRRMLKQEGW